MKKYVCGPCGYEYDPEVGDPDNGIAPKAAKMASLGQKASEIHTRV